MTPVILASIPLMLQLVTGEAQVAPVQPQTPSGEAPPKPEEAETKPTEQAQVETATEQAPTDVDVTTPADASKEAAAEAPSPSQEAAPQDTTSQDATAVAVPTESQSETAHEPEASEAQQPDGLSVDPESIKFKGGKGLMFQSRDGTFAMAIRSRVQIRHEYEHDPAADPEGAHLLNIRRARLVIGGHFFGEHNKYKLQLALSPRDMSFGPTGAQRSPVLDAIVEFDYLRDATVSVGQYMVPWNRQRIVSSGDFELVDRSIASGEFQLDRDIGVQFSSNDLFGLGHIRYLAAVFSGEGRDADALGDSGLLYVARVEVLPMGDSKNRWDYEEGDQENNKKPRVSLGAAYAYQQHALRNRGVMGNVPTDGGTTDMHVVTADAVAQWMGFSLTGEFYLRQAERNFGDATAVDDTGATVAAPQEAARNGSGWFVQGGYVLPWIPVGLAARYSRVIAADSATSLTGAQEIGGGPSWYMFGHDLKLQADYFRQYETDIGVGVDVIRTQLSAGF